MGRKEELKILIENLRYRLEIESKVSIHKTIMKDTEILEDVKIIKEIVQNLEDYLEESIGIKESILNINKT